jgi:LuxR family transcriptional regulator, quorum-sensing system regulator CviR
VNANSNDKPASAGEHVDNALTLEEQQLYLAFVQASQRIDTTELFQKNIQLFVRPLFPHAMTLACVGGIVNGKAVLEMAIALNYPDALFSKVHEIVNIADRSLLARWYMQRKPQLIELGKNDYLLSAMERSEMDVFNFDNFAAHGVIDVDGKRGSYISLAGIPGTLGPHHEFLLELMVPHLHQALVRILRHQRDGQTFTNTQLLTPKERVVLRWIAEGKSNPEIAALLNRSVSTIRNQVHSILGKLGASSRAEALHKSHELRLL